MHRLHAKERTRLARIARCKALLKVMPMNFKSCRWVKEMLYVPPDCACNASAHISYNGRIMLLENTWRPDDPEQIRVTRASITLEDDLREDEWKGAVCTGPSSGSETTATRPRGRATPRCRRTGRCIWGEA